MHRKMKHSFAEMGQISGSGEQVLHPLGNARPCSPGLLEGRGIAKRGEGRISTCGTDGLSVSTRSLKSVNQPHKFIDLGYDAVLLRDRR